MRTIQVSKDRVMCPVAKDYPITPLQLRILMKWMWVKIYHSTVWRRWWIWTTATSPPSAKNWNSKATWRGNGADDERFITLKLTHNGQAILQKMEQDIEGKYCLLMEGVSEERLEKIAVGIKELPLIQEMNEQQRGLTKHLWQMTKQNNRKWNLNLNKPTTIAKGQPITWWHWERSQMFLNYFAATSYLNRSVEEVTYSVPG